MTHLQPAKWVHKTLRVSQIYFWFRKSFHCDLHIASSVDWVVRAAVIFLWTTLWKILSGLLPWEIRLESIAWPEQWHCQMLLCVIPALPPGMWSAHSSGLPLWAQCNHWSAEKTFLLSTCSSFCFGFAVLLAASASFTSWKCLGECKDFGGLCQSWKPNLLPPCRASLSGNCCKI